MNQPPPIYLGISAVMRSAHAAFLLKLMPPGIRFMCGVQADDRTLRRLGNPNPKRYPAFEDIAGIFPEQSPSTLNLLHLHTEDAASLGFYMDLATRAGGGNLQGIQLDVPFPDPGIIREHKGSRYGRGHVIVLQVGREMQYAAGMNESMLAVLLKPYAGIVDYVLIDGSEGTGKEMTAFVGDCFRAIREAGLDFGLVAAGGLRPDNAARLLGNLARFHKPFSLDAEGGKAPEGADRAARAAGCDRSGVKR